MPLLGDHPQNIAIMLGTENWNGAATRYWKKSEGMFTRCDKIHECDRQTDIQTLHDGIVHLCTAMCGKKPTKHITKNSRKTNECQFFVGRDADVWLAALFCGRTFNIGTRRAAQSCGVVAFRRTPFTCDTARRLVLLTASVVRDILLHEVKLYALTILISEVRTPGDTDSDLGLNAKLSDAVKFFKRICFMEMLKSQMYKTTMHINFICCLSQIFANQCYQVTRLKRFNLWILSVFMKF